MITKKNKKLFSISPVIPFQYLFPFSKFYSTIKRGSIFYKPEVIKPQEFKTFSDRILSNYNQHLHKIITDNNIVSVIMIAANENGSFSSVSHRTAFKFNYDEIQNWDFLKSPYYTPLEKLVARDKSTCENDIQDLEPFDYKFIDSEAPLNLDQLFVWYIGNLADFLERYYGQSLLHIDLHITTVGDKANHSTTPKNINSIPLKKNVSNIKDIRKSFNQKLLPLTLNESSYGKRSYATRCYIDEENNLKRVVTDIDKDTTKKEVFNLKSGVLLDSFTDTMLDDKSFLRRSEKTKSALKIKEDKILRSYMDIKLPNIPKSRESTANTFNKNIGSLDLETYKNSKTNKNEVYAIGFAYGGNNVLISQPNVNTYYLEEGKTSEDIVLDCINEMLTTKYDKVRFYVHNLGGFDVFFILKILGEYNKKVGIKYYGMKAVLKDKRILKLTISVKKKSTKNTIYLLDSYTLLPSSLASLAKSFSTKYLKQPFPYTFVEDSTLHYIGKTPRIEFYNRDITKSEHKSLYKKDWNLKQETLKYLESDLISLIQIMYEFSKQVFESYNVQVTECLTITSISLKIFLSKYYNIKKGALPLIRNIGMYKDVKEGYFGGLSEVYKPYGENLYYYDVNSLYPYAALNDMPSTKCQWIETYEDESLDIEKDNLFGFFYCEVQAPESYYGLLPVRHLGLLTYPIGEFEGWWFSEQLKYAIEQGYKIKIIKGYNFNKVSNIFEDYVKTIYEDKRTSTGAKRLINKFLLNSLLGRFGMHVDKLTSTLTDSEEEYLDIITKHKVKSDVKITEGLYILNHSPTISKNVCEQYGVDYIECINKNPKLVREDESSIDNVSIVIAAAVTAYSSIYMLKIKKHILDKGGEIYYTDTDSIITNINLDHISGGEIGLFKPEYKIIRGYFISSKLYCIVVWDEKEGKEEVIIKAKGVYAWSLTEEDFKNMLEGYRVETAIKGHSEKSYEEGYVNIGEKRGIKLNPESYKKRVKVFTDKWVDTKPLKLVKKTPDLVDNAKESCTNINKPYKEKNSVTDKVDKIKVVDIESNYGVKNNFNFNKPLHTMIYLNNPKPDDLFFFKVLCFLSMLNVMWLLYHTSAYFNIEAYSEYVVLGVEYLHLKTNYPSLTSDWLSGWNFLGETVLENNYTKFTLGVKEWFNSLGVIDTVKSNHNPTYTSVRMSHPINIKTLTHSNELDSLLSRTGKSFQRSKWNWLSFNNHPIHTKPYNYNTLNSKINVLDYLNVIKKEFHNILNYTPKNIFKDVRWIENVGSVSNTNPSTPDTQASITRLSSSVQFNSTSLELLNRRLSFYNKTRDQINMLEKFYDLLLEKKERFIYLDCDSPISPNDTSSKVTKISLELDLKNYGFEISTIKAKYGVLSPARARSESQLLIILNDSIKNLNSKMFKTNVLLDSLREGLTK